MKSEAFTEGIIKLFHEVGGMYRGSYQTISYNYDMIEFSDTFYLIFYFITYYHTRPSKLV